ncbi:MAG: VOC family protein [Thermoplasmata archaeon]|jgi:catechol 2,3-dioxygenase-like lactoylglutathione lyase family enzyme
MIQDPSINIFSRNVERLTSFYQRLGFKETYRTPKEGPPSHVEVTLDHFTLGVSSVEAAIKDHGLNPSLDGRPVAIILWTDDSDRDYVRLLTEGAKPLRPPHDFRSDLRTAWVSDPDGNPINLAQRRSVKSRR